MSSATSRYGWGLVCAALLSIVPLASSAHAWPYSSGYGYSAYYGAPLTYTAGYRSTAGYGYGVGYRYGVGYGYGAGYGPGCCLTSLFHGCGLFGCCRPTYATNYAPAYANPCCNPCGYACSPCDPCGVGCVGNCPSGACPTGECGISTTPYSGQPAFEGQGSSPPPNPSTYAPKTIPEDNMTSPDGPFRAPERIMPRTDDGTPGGPEDSEIERGIDYNGNRAPADVEPGETGDLKVDDDAAQPLKLELQFASRSQPQRSRAHYRAVFRAPKVARADVPAPSPWTPIESNDAQLASSK